MNEREESGGWIVQRKQRGGAPVSRLVNKPLLSINGGEIDQGIHDEVTKGGRGRGIEVPRSGNISVNKRWCNCTENGRREQESPIDVYHEGTKNGTRDGW